jgi:hypothetical protein
MNDIMTIEQIYEQFDSEWVLLEDPETNKTLHVQRGRVICHSKDRDEVYKKALDSRAKRFAVLYTGMVPPKGAAIAI